MKKKVRVNLMQAISKVMIRGAGMCSCLGDEEEGKGQSCATISNDQGDWDVLMLS